MFPPQLAAVFIRWLTSPGDAVFDPFSGRGTVALEASLSGRQAFAGDANPLAHALTRAKLRVPSAAGLGRRLTELDREFATARVDLQDVPDDIRMLYAPGTLRQLVFLRERLSADRPTDAFIVALVLGMLHANHSSAGATRGFSISMPNTFAMAPGYVRSYISREGLVAPEVNVFEMLRARAARYRLPTRMMVGGQSWLRDATKRPPLSVRSARPKLVITSPPYLEVIKYGKYNWVRLWFLGHEPRDVDAGLMATGSLSRYLSFMESVLARLKETVAADGYVCLIVGDVRRGSDQINLAGKLWRHAAEPTGWHCHALVADQLPAGSKVSRIWKGNPGRATKVDRILLLSPSSDVALPSVPTPSWTDEPNFAANARKG